MGGAAHHQQIVQDLLRMTRDGVKQAIKALDEPAYANGVVYTSIKSHPVGTLVSIIESDPESPRHRCDIHYPLERRQPEFSEIDRVPISRSTEHDRDFRRVDTCRPQLVA